jgi:hypothetical protein
VLYELTEPLGGGTTAGGGVTRSLRATARAW